MGDPGIIPPSKVSGGTQSSMGGSLGGAAATLANLARKDRERGIPPAIPGASGFPTQQLNLFQLTGRVWTRWTCDRPTILLPVVSNINAVEANATLAGAQSPIYYVPNTQPAGGSAGVMAVPENAMQVAQVSRGCGVVYLPKAGSWNLYWEAANTVSKVNLLVIDASDPGVAARYLFEDGCHAISVNTTITVTIADQTILASNRLRKGFLISIGGTVVTNPVRLGFNAAASNVAGAKIGTANQPTAFSMSGENCFKGNIHAIRDAVAVADVEVNITEWF